MALGNIGSAPYLSGPTGIDATSQLDPFVLEVRRRDSLEGLWQSVVLLATSSLSLALAIAYANRFELIVALVEDNRIDATIPFWLIAFAASMLAAIAALGVQLAQPAARPLVQALARFTSPLILSAFLPALFAWRIWIGHDLEQLFFAAALILATKKLVYFSLSTPTSTLSTTAIGRWLQSLAECGRQDAAFMRRALPTRVATWAVLLGIVWYAVFFSYHTIVHHRNGLTASFDLGLEENIVYNILHGNRPILKSSPLGGPAASHLGSHATWFAFLLAPLYALWQRAESLLIIQAILMGAAALPLYLLAKRFISTPLALLVAYTYLLFPGLHGAALYDFHYLPLGPFFLWFALYFTEKRRWALVTLFALISLSVREDVAVGLGFLGGLWMLSGRRPYAALAILFLGGGYFVVMKGIVMHRAFGGGDAFVHQYRLLIPEGDRGFSGVVKTILSNPAYTWSTLVERQKLVYFLQIMLPLAFFPLRRPIGIWACLPGLLFALFSTEYPPLLMISFQYTTYWSAQLFPTMVLNLHWMDQQVRSGVKSAAWKWSWIAAVTLGTLCMSHQYGALFQQNTVVGGFGRYHFGIQGEDLKRRKDLAAVLGPIPRHAKVVSSENIVPQIANRVDAYTLRIGVFDAEYIVFRCPNSGEEGRNIARALDSGSFGVVLESGEFVMAKRGYPTGKNATYIARVGGVNQ